MKSYLIFSVLAMFAIIFLFIGSKIIINVLAVCFTILVIGGLGVFVMDKMGIKRRD